jgi:antirestriction protein ArdC
MATGKKKFDISEMITDKILAQLEKGVVPWQKPWIVKGVPQMNLATKKPYRGVNIMLTSMAGFGSPYWVSYKQAQRLGGNVKKEESKNYAFVIFWNWIKKEDENGKETKIPYMRYYRIYNVEQCEGFEDKIPKPKEIENVVEPSKEADKIVENYFDQNCKLSFGGDSAYYSPTRDAVGMPLQEQFTSTAGYYGTIFHEMAHSTGHKSRLNRKEITEPTNFGSHAYSKEELVAEIGSAMLTNKTGMDIEFDNSVAYIKAWAKALNDDKRLIIHAGQRAQKAVDYILEGEK